jgi:hypothetical protein
LRCELPLIRLSCPEHFAQTPFAPEALPFLRRGPAIPKSDHGDLPPTYAELGTAPSKLPSIAWSHDAKRPAKFAEFGEKTLKLNEILGG